VMKVEIDWAKVTAFDVRLDVGGFHPKKEVLRYQNVVDACSVSEVSPAGIVIFQPVR